MIRIFAQEFDPMLNLMFILFWEKIRQELKSNALENIQVRKWETCWERDKCDYGRFVQRERERKSWLLFHWYVLERN